MRNDFQTTDLAGAAAFERHNGVDTSPDPDPDPADFRMAREHCPGCAATDCLDCAMRVLLAGWGRR